VALSVKATNFAAMGYVLKEAHMIIAGAAEKDVPPTRFAAMGTA
jgi:hypothetical protein